MLRRPELPAVPRLAVVDAPHAPRIRRRRSADRRARSATAAARSSRSRCARTWLAALLDRDAGRPAIVVAGDDRAARDLAAGAARRGSSRGRSATTRAAASPTSRTWRRRRTWSACGSRRSTRCWSRATAPRWSSSAPSRCRRRSPIRRCARTASRCATGELLDLDETALRSRRGRLRARRPGRGPRPVRDPRRAAGRVPGDRGPRRAGRPVRRRDRVAAVVLDLHAALARATPSWSRSRRPPSSREEHRELAEIAALEDAADRPDIAELLPVEEFHPFLELVPAGATSLIAGEEDVAPALADHWQDVTAAFHDEDAHHLYVAPDAIAAGARAAGADPAVEHRPGPAVRVPRPGRRCRRARAQGGRAGAREARALGLPDRGRVRAPRRGRARRLQPRPAEGAAGSAMGEAVRAAGGAWRR